MHGIIDTHTHYCSGCYDDDRHEIIAGLPELGVMGFLEVAAYAGKQDEPLKLAAGYPYARATVGVHPDEAGMITDSVWAHMKKLLSFPKAAAVGETGLDYHTPRDAEPVSESRKYMQRIWFERHIGLAREYGKPLVIHSRDAAQDTMRIIRDNITPGMRGVMHCFAYSKEIAQECVDMGFSIGVGGVVTFKNARRLKEVVAAVPLSSIVLETDCPYMAPEPNRGRRNQSDYLTYVARAIAQIKCVNESDVICATSENASRLFGF